MVHNSFLPRCLHVFSVRFHVLSRTAHTDRTQAFWFHHNSILHATNHLKYQELSIFFAISGNYTHSGGGGAPYEETRSKRAETFTFYRPFASCVGLAWVGICAHGRGLGDVDCETS